MALERLIRRETRASTVINAVLSAVFFLAVFGTQARFLSFGAPDQLARDFLPQGGVIALMATLVPALLVRKAWRRQGHAGRATGVILAQAARSVATGLTVSAVLMVIFLYDPVIGVDWVAAFVAKVMFGGLLGAAITRWSLRRLFGQEQG